MKPVRGPWGGSSPFVAGLTDVLERSGYEVRFDLDGDVDVIVLIDPRHAPNKPFGVAEIAEYKSKHPRARVLHRVNECDKRKNTDFMDRLLADASQVADGTVFISDWLRDYHAERWFDRSRPHSVIYNGADDGIFYPPRTRRPGPPCRIVTHHWSSDPLKGYDVYEQVDRMLESGRLKGFEFWVVGRPPPSIRWKRARVIPPRTGRRLADTLRACDIYLTASRWEPCGMHHVEGAQCGLPLVYHEDGGGIVEAGRRYGIGFSRSVGDAIERMRMEYPAHRANTMAAMPSGLGMCLAYVRRISELMADA